MKNKFYLCLIAIESIIVPTFSDCAKYFFVGSHFWVAHSLSQLCLVTLSANDIPFPIAIVVSKKRFLTRLFFDAIALHRCMYYFHTQTKSHHCFTEVHAHSEKEFGIYHFNPNVLLFLKKTIDKIQACFRA